MPKKEKTYQPERFTLTSSQIEKLAKIAEHFKEVDQFTLEETHESGIGSTVRVRFKLFNNNDTNVDITDVSTW
jgi:hypothetical protein